MNHRCDENEDDSGINKIFGSIIMIESLAFKLGIDA